MERSKRERVKGRREGWRDEEKRGEGGREG